MKKTVKTMTLALVTMAMSVSMLMPASAAGYNISENYKSYATCTLRNTRNPGYVTIGVYNTSIQWGRTQRNSVRMTDTKGRNIWEEKGAIAFNGSRRFYLGNDHKAYRIYVKTYYGKGCADFYSPSNVTVKITK